MHMQPRGKPVPVQPSIGFYFTDLPPTNTPVKIGLKSYSIDIPAGATNYSVAQKVILPVDSDLLALLPHAHYLGKRLEGYALLPDGTRKTLLLIPQWDFNWQSDFRFKNPIFLPKGTTLGMLYTFDNSTNGLRQPQNPPVEVKYGLQTTQEMAELHFQLLAHSARDRDRLADAANQFAIEDVVALDQHRLREDPSDAEAIVGIAKAALSQGDVRGAEGLLRRAIVVRPGLTDAHYSLGTVLLDQAKFPEAEWECLEALRLDPQHFKAANNAGLCCMRQGKLEDAAAHFQEALRLRPGDTIAQENLSIVVNAKRARKH
jgi:tetratricopeptide (TPR) repeat protein